MSLPAACPGDTIMSSSNDTCWADIPFPGGTATYRCRVKIDPDDELGLCADHRAELVEIDELEPYRPLTRRY